VTVIRISDKATGAGEVIKELRKTADFIESFHAQKELRVIVTGELNIDVHLEKPMDEKARLIADIRNHLPYLRIGWPALADEIEAAMKQVESETKEAVPV
jgi:hypothetical protein